MSQAHQHRPGAAMVQAIALLAVAVLPFTALAADSYDIDPVHSYVSFRIKHLGVGFSYGRFNDVAGSFVLDRQAPQKSTVEVRIKADSVDTRNEQRDKHLRSPDFFNAKQFPSITFKSSSVKPTGPDSAEITGELSLHGVTKPITVKATRTGEGKDPYGKERAGFELVFQVKRSEFGMTFMLDGLSDEVQVTASFEGVKK